ncbi:MAG: bile acid:sodium symporter [Candidatus Hydrogenedentes bacterium]|nr:bile acid:sodium symporter [Candidatus Hydrogenedentota bacterium]
MKKILSTIQKNLVWAIPVVMLAGFLFGSTIMDVSFLKRLIIPLTFLMVYPMMVNLQVRKIFEGGDTKVQIVTQILNFTVIPFIAYTIGKIAFPDSPYIALGLLLASLLPTSGMTISWTGMARGNMPAAVKMTVFGLLIGSALTPIYIKVLMGTELDIPMAKIFQQIVVVVLLPLILGNATQRFLISRYGQAHYQKDLKSLFPPFSTLGVLGIVFVAMALKAPAIASDPALLGRLLIPVGILYAINFTISTLIGRLFFSRKDAIALVYGSVMRNLSIALAIAMSAFGKEGSEIALIIALAYIIQVQSAAWYVKFTDIIFGKAQETTVGDIMLEGIFALYSSDTLKQAINLLAEEHIHCVAILNAEDKPVGMISSNTLIDALADEVPFDAALSELTMEPVLTSTPQTSLKTALANMKRNHEYKALVTNEKNEVSHILTQEEILRHVAEQGL